MDANVFRCIKYVMCIFNLIIFLGGTGLITLGAWISANPRSFREVVGIPPPSLMGAGGYVAVGLGFLLAVLGFLGCCGAARESKVLLLAFFVLVLFFFVVEVVATVVMLILKGRLTEEFFRNQLRRRYVGDNGTDIFNRAWNTIMATLQCCGASGPADFAHDSRFLRTAGGRLVPNACCTQLSGGAINTARCLRLEPGFFHRQGCYIALGKTLRASQSLVGGVGAAILTTEVLAMASAMCLLHGMN
uniref:Tetraspanin n=2 Tax=Eptatretus burgeri TaxID=7764 RepID=A0A8C4QJM6_EPTBU